MVGAHARLSSHTDARSRMFQSSDGTIDLPWAPLRNLCAVQTKATWGGGLFLLASNYFIDATFQQTDSFVQNCTRQVLACLFTNLQLLIEDEFMFVATTEHL